MAEDARKLLVYGGAFNPPHLGHLRYFESAVGVVKPDIAMILPSGVSPHKKNGTTPFAHRAAMCRIFKKVEGAKVVISGIENLKKPCRSYTIKSLRRLRRRYKGYDIYFMIGSDMLLSFKSWHLWRRILAMCTLVVGVRDDDHSEESSEPGSSWCPSSPSRSAPLRFAAEHQSVRAAPILWAKRTMPTSKNTAFIKACIRRAEP